jgi:hypothetical protein
VRFWKTPESTDFGHFVKTVMVRVRRQSLDRRIVGSFSWDGW